MNDESTVPITIPHSIAVSLDTHLGRYEINADRRVEAAARLRAQLSRTGLTMHTGPRVDVDRPGVEVLAWVLGRPLHRHTLLRPTLQTPHETAGYRELLKRLRRHANIERSAGEEGFRVCSFHPHSPLSRPPRSSEASRSATVVQPALF